MKEQIKAPEKIQLSNEEILNLSHAQFKTLVIRKLTELVEFGRKLNEKMKAILRETIRENQDGGVGRHTAPPRTTRTDKKSKGKEVQHQGDKKTFIQTGRRGGDRQPGRKGLALPWQDRDWPSVGQMGQAV